MIKKTITYLLLISFTYIISINKVDAYTISVPSFGETEGEEGREEWSKGETYTGDEDINKKTIYQCYYKTQISVVNDITAKGYNPENEPIIEESLVIPEEDRIVAGTSVGISLIERKTINWSIKARIQKETHSKVDEYDYDCHYKLKSPTLIPRPRDPIRDITPMNSITLFSRIQSIAVICGTIRQDKLPCNRNPNVNRCESNGYTPVLVESDEKVEIIEECTTSDCNLHLSKCQNEASTAAAAMATAAAVPSVKIQLPDSNDIDGEDKVTISSVGCTGTCNFTPAPGQTSGGGTAIFNYKKTKACINVKNSRVSYKAEPCTDEEIEIKNDILGEDEHWHYFIPLNSKSTEPLEINIIPSGDGGKLDKKQCIYLLENVGLDKETTYVDLIIKKNGDNFEGITRLDREEMEKNGCQLTAKIKIYPKQKFYNEEKNGEDNIIFKGFNFYYKPINIKNPFPNGLTGESIWKEWNDTYKSGGSENPRIIESFDEKNLTYVAPNINAKKIREYNKNNSYTSWSNMMLDGRSKYIENEGIILRQDSALFYKLGCGPENADWSECK